MGRPKEKYAIGISLENRMVHYVKVKRSDDKIEILDAQFFKLKDTDFAAEAGTDAGTAEEVEINLDMDSVDSARGGGKLDISEDPLAAKDNNALLLRMFNDYREFKYKAGISLSEPDIFYLNLASDWGLKGKKFQAKVIEEVAKVKGEGKKVKPDDYEVIPLANERLALLVKNREVKFLNLFETLKRKSPSHYPSISFVESLETSTTNVINYLHELEEEKKSVVVYIGEESSRILFYQGKKLLHISQLIGEGVSNRDIANILYSRLLFEMDNLNQENIDKIILCGKIRENIKSVFESSFAGEAEVKPITFSAFDVTGLIPEVLSLLPEYSAAIGAAVRILDGLNGDFYKADLTPTTIKTGQKTFNFGLPGWILLVIIFLTVVFGASRIINLMSQTATVNQQAALKSADVAEFDRLTFLNDSLQNAVAQKESYVALIDRLTVGSKTWSSFLTSLVAEVDSLGEMWISDIISVDESHIIIIGQSLYRNRISQLTELTAGAELQKVEVFDIREKDLYRFTLKVTLTPK